MWRSTHGKGRVMKKKSKKIEPTSLRPIAYTADQLEQMAWSLVNRGLATRAIIETRFTKPQFNRGSRHGDHSAYERK